MRPTKFYTYTLNPGTVIRITPAAGRSQRVVVSLASGGSANIGRVPEETRLAGAELNLVAVYRLISPIPTSFEVESGEALYATGGGAGILLSVASVDSLDAAY